MRKKHLLRQWAWSFFSVSIVLWVLFVWLGPHGLFDAEGTVPRWRLGVFGFLFVFAFGLLGWVVWRPVGRRVEEISRAVKAYANGDFARRLPCPDNSELSVLAGELNWMAQQFSDRQEEQIRRQQELDAVLSSMAEGMIAIDEQERIIKVNRSAREWLNLEHVDYTDQPVKEVLRQASLNDFIRLATASTQPLRAEIELNGQTRRQMQVNSAVLRDEQRQRLGVLIMLNDLTQLRRLENMRRDFVANVSHELKTPITSIKGFMETLRDGAINDPEAAERFLDIIHKQADRLDAIIEDLLSLSRIEQESQRDGMDVEEAALQESLNVVATAMEPRAKERNITLSVSCPANLKARINAPLLEQAVSNLVDNALKYSHEGTTVWVTAQEHEDVIQIDVADQGPGIAKEHQSRVFERFYRIDKSRSRRLGGTGLGLSIVKHIVQAHRGDVQVKSEPGQGCVFTIRLPR